MDAIKHTGDTAERTPYSVREQAALNTVAPSSGQTDRQNGVLNGLRILVVEDEADIRELLTIVLEQNGAQVTVAGSTAEGLNLFKRLRPNILVSDIGLPGEDGYALIRKIRVLEQGQTEQVPAIALTAHTRLEDRRHALSAGYHMHVPKTIELAKLVEIIASLLEHDGTGPRVARS